jgi:ABC-2 type transport system permease protein
VLAALGEQPESVRELLGVMGGLLAVLMLTLGVLATAGEWTHRTVQTTFLFVPRRGKVIAAKYAGTAALALVICPFAVASTLGVAALTAGPDFAWTGVGAAIAATIAAGAAFALTGAGIGAAIANAPAALASSYVTILVALPLLHTAQPDIADKIDPVHAMMNLATSQHTATSAAVLTGWVVLTTAAGAAVTRRKALA